MAGGRPEPLGGSLGGSSFRRTSHDTYSTDGRTMGNDDSGDDLAGVNDELLAAVVRAMDKLYCEADPTYADELAARIGRQRYDRIAASLDRWVRDAPIDDDELDELDELERIEMTEPEHDLLDEVELALHKLHNEADPTDADKLAARLGRERFDILASVVGPWVRRPRTDD